MPRPQSPERQLIELVRAHNPDWPRARVVALAEVVGVDRERAMRITQTMKW